MNLRTIRTLNSWPLSIGTSAQQSGGGNVPAMAKPDQLAADFLRRKPLRAYCAAAELYTILLKVQPSSWRNCTSQLAQLHLLA